MTQREAFETWAIRKTSISSAHEMAWAAWQAATAAERERCAKLCDFVEKLGREDRMTAAVTVAAELSRAIRQAKIPPDG